MKKGIAMGLCLALLLSIAGCAAPSATSAQPAYTPISGLDTTQDVVLNFAIEYETDSALDAVANAFMERYPNVCIHTEYVENYGTNAIELFRQGDVDMIFRRDVKYAEETVTNPVTGAETLTNTDECYYNFAADDEIDFSHTTEKLMGNYCHTRSDENGKEITYQYSIPLGGEVRGLFVNKTLLKSMNLSVPTNWTEFLDCCETLKQAGYVPIQGNPASAATALMLADCVNAVSHDETALTAMRQAQPGTSVYFEPSMEKLYTLSQNHYYDYKYVEEEQQQFVAVTDVGQARSFLGLVRNEQTYEYAVPDNHYGNVAFFPYLSSLGPTIDKLIDDYNLDTDYTFIVTPTAQDRNSPTYLTPYIGLCANKNSKNLIWLREFVNFFLQEENTGLYAEKAGIIPNRPDAIPYMANKYGVSEDACASCGDIYFSDSYNGYTPLSAALINVAKCNAPKYMVVLADSDGNDLPYLTDETGGEYLLTGGEVPIYREYIGPEDSARPGNALCSLAFYMDQLETAFSAYAES